MPVAHCHGQDADDVESGYHDDETQYQGAKPFFQTDRCIQVAVCVHPGYDVKIRSYGKGGCDAMCFIRFGEPNLDARDLVAPSQVALCRFERYECECGVQFFQSRVKDGGYFVGPQLRLLSH